LRKARQKSSQLRNRDLSWKLRYNNTSKQKVLYLLKKSSDKRTKYCLCPERVPKRKISNMGDCKDPMNKSAKSLLIKLLKHLVEAVLSLKKKRLSKRQFVLK